MNIIRRRTGFKHFTYEDRVRMETYIREYWPRGRKIVWARLGRLMNRSGKSIQREYQQGKATNKGTYLADYETYSAEKGRLVADQSRGNKGPRMKLTHRIARQLEHWIVERKCSPYVALKRMRPGNPAWLPCVRSVYYAIHRGDLELVRQNLPYGPIRMKPRRTGQRMAYKRIKGKSIEQRPPEADARTQYGHWEMDTVVGGRNSSAACLLVLTERMSRLEIIRRLPDRSQRSVLRALNGLERQPNTIFATMKSLTFDNGSEFWDPDVIETSVSPGRAKRCTLYYAHPFSAFERGSNENNNRITRRLKICHYLLQVSSGSCTAPPHKPDRWSKRA